jgi:hypothetical protein
LRWVEFAKGIPLNFFSRSWLSGVLLLLFLAGSNTWSFPNDSARVNSTSIVRSQLQSIADEVMASVDFDGKERVAVMVEGDGPKMLTENAFIEALQKRKYSLIVFDTASTNQILHVFVFSPEIKIHDVDGKFSVRNIQTIVEARKIKGADHGVRILGAFQRETKDTTDVFSAGSLAGTQKDNDTGLFQRMVTPFVVLGGAIVIVYLFFTVRS